MCDIKKCKEKGENILFMLPNTTTCKLSICMSCMEKYDDPVEVVKNIKKEVKLIDPEEDNDDFFVSNDKH